MAEDVNVAAANRTAYNREVFTLPLSICAIGLMTSLVAAILSDEVDTLAFVGYIILSLGTMLALNALVKEKYRLGRNIGFPLKMIFPSYPRVEDFDALTQDMTNFRAVYSDFLANHSRPDSNRALQNYATQFLWHCLYLQKKRMEKFDVWMRLESNRRAYVKRSNGVRSLPSFDGRYHVNAAQDEVYAIRTFYRGNREIAKVYDTEVAHYTFLSAKTVGQGEVICPNCGNRASRSNLMDGCDYCHTKFTVEDLDNRVSHFAFRRDFQASESKRKAIKKVIYPWVYMICMMPMMYTGFFLPFFYGTDVNIFTRLAIAVLSATVLGIGGFALASFSLFYIVPLVALGNRTWGVLNDKLIYRPEADVERDLQMATQVRESDPLFSLQHFFSNVQNKLYTIHFAENTAQINALSACDLSMYLPDYKNVIDVDTLSIAMDSYRIEHGMQIATVSAELLLREFANGKLQHGKEKLTLCLEKNASCTTQDICAPSILTCKNCGNSLSLMEGKTCPFCGTELDMKEHDWVIITYARVQK